MLIQYLVKFEVRGMLDVGIVGPIIVEKLNLKKEVHFNFQII